MVQQDQWDPRTNADKPWRKKLHPPEDRLPAWAGAKAISRAAVQVLEAAIANFENFISYLSVIKSKQLTLWSKMVRKLLAKIPS